MDRARWSLPPDLCVSKQGPGRVISKHLAAHGVVADFGDVKGIDDRHELCCCPRALQLKNRVLHRSPRDLARAGPLCR